MTLDMLLVSNTSVHGGAKFEHAREEIKYLFSNVKEVTFIPYARPGGKTYEEYADMMRPTFESMGYKLKLIDEENPIKSIKDAKAIYIGGGNTSELLKQLKENGLLHHIRQAIRNGTPYLGSSAGSNVAGLTIGNTNDMPAAESHGRDALALVPFNINPHYVDPMDTNPEELRELLGVEPEIFYPVLESKPGLKQALTHQGETREARINEYHGLGNMEPVVAMREGAMIRVAGGLAYLRGNTGGRLFMQGSEPQELEPNSVLDFQIK